MKLFELLLGLKKPTESRAFTVDGNPTKYSYDDLSKMGFSSNDMEHIRFMKPGETRTLRRRTIKRIDAE